MLIIVKNIIELFYKNDCLHNIYLMNNLNSTVFSVEQSNYNSQQQGLQDSRLNKSFIDNKPMIQGLVRSILKVDKGGEAHLINTGLTDVEGAKQIAANLFSFYDKDRTGTIDPVKVFIF